ncbi:electron transfer flavoprotein beta subunit lysine methyltransferase-like isoform X2 [Vespa mandarinia]|uniref:electron transfer flavoprotein beta subunit lysine methyltransferase-like isoform X2 n=1 Tax=Vespa mandarinia TaxID=7446 RepID=UPI001618B017|nr:electron transfer flavoprotein beta subunit lysine methyltransferase-like isoform X2 [Vespa mandarinia]
MRFLRRRIDQSEGTRINPQKEKKKKKGKHRRSSMVVFLPRRFKRTIRRMGRGVMTSCTLIKRSMSRKLPGSLLIKTIRNRNWENLDRDIAERAKIVDTILKYTEITNDHMTPDLKLFLLTPRCSLYHDPFDRVKKEFDQVEKQTFTNPFWSIYWPGGQGLVKFIFQEQRNIFIRSKDINVLDLGSGCGATAIATKLLGIRNVVANDIDKVACIATLMNATLNDVDVQVSWKNLLNEPLKETYDIIFIGDLLYEEELAETLIPWLLDASKKGTRIFLGDPGRHGLTISRS